MRPPLGAGTSLASAGETLRLTRKAQRQSPPSALSVVRGETEALGAEVGPAPPHPQAPPQPGLSPVSLVLKSFQGKTHTLKTLASPLDLSFPVTV